MPLRPPVLTGLLVAALAAGLAGQAPTSRPTAPSGAPLPGVSPAPQQPQTPPAATAGTSTGIIRGRVVRADTSRPLPRARVIVRIQVAATSQHLSATTDDEGRYELKGLAAGRYDLIATKDGFVEQRYGQRRPGDSTQPLQLAERQSIDRIDFALSPGGVITGSVVDESGEPLAGVVVEVMTPRYVQGRRELRTSNNLDVTDDLGRFRLFGIPQGRWVVKATSPDRAPDPTGLPLRTGTFTYYPGTNAAAEAQAIQVDAGSELTGLTIAVAPERHATITGMVHTSDGGVPPRGVMFVLSLRDGGRAKLGTFVLPDGSFAISNLPSGRYIVAAAPSMTQGVGAMTEIALDGVNVSVDLTLQKPSSARGRITFDTDAPPAALRPTSVRVGVEPSSIFPALFAPTGTTRDDWTFEVAELVGPNHLRVTVPEGWAVESIRLDGKDITDRPLDVAGKDIDGLVVHLTQRVSAVRGQVSDPRGQKATDATVVIFADDPAQWTFPTRFVRAVRPDKDGRFDVRGLPAARYVAVALEFLEPGEETNPETLEELQRLGTGLTLDSGGTAIVDLKVSPAP